MPHALDHDDAPPTPDATGRTRPTGPTGRWRSCRRWSASRPSPTATRRASTPRPSTRSSPSSRAVPAAARAARRSPASAATACCFHWAGRSARPPGRADGAPRRRTGRRVGARGSTRRSAPRSSTAPSGAAAPSTTRARWPRSARRSSACSRPGTRPRRTSGCRSAATRRSRAPRARSAVEELRAPRRRPWFVLDEGGAVAHEAFPGVSRADRRRSASPRRAPPRVELRAEGRGGHASTPGPDGPTARHRPGDPAPGRAPRCRPACPAPTVELMRRLAPHARSPLRPLLADAARLRPLAHPRAGRRRARAGRA